MADTYKNLHVE